MNNRHGRIASRTTCFPAILLAWASIACVAQAQEANHETRAAAIYGVVARVDIQGAASPLAGILVKLTPARPDAASESAASDSEGKFRFDGVAPGSYLLEVAVDGFNPFSTTLQVGRGDMRAQDVRLELASVATAVEVKGDMQDVTAHVAEPNGTLSEQEFPALPMAQEKFSEALPIIPGVVRTVNGAVSVKGEAANQGMLLVDSARMVDPVTGAFSISVPLAAIQSLSVFESPFNSQYGGFSGGLVSVETKAPPSQWRYSLMDFVPGLRMKNGHIAGVSAETPRLYVGGPLIPNRLNFSESFDYTIKNQPVRGQPWPRNETLMRGFTSFTNLQAILSPRHLLAASLAVFSDRLQFADINSLVPQTASSNSGSKGAFATLTDTTQFGAGTLNTTFRYTRFKSNAYGQGDQDLLITPEGLGGNAFNRWKRTANQFEMLPSFQPTQKRWLGYHDLTLGADVVHQYYDGDSHSNAIHVLREDGSLAERIDFSGSGTPHGSESEASEFIQDHWTLNQRLALDAGLRLTSQTNGRSAAFAPRLGLVKSLGFERKTVLRAGAGYFYDRVPALAATFLQNPTRVVTLYDAAGTPATGPTMFRNAYVDLDNPGQIRTTGDPGTSPRNLTWRMELERELTASDTLKVSYLQSQTSQLYFVTPLTGAGQAQSVLGLGHSGNSRYNEFQTSVHHRFGQRGDFSLAYLRSEAKGSLNTLSNTFVPFEQPIIRTNINDYLPYDVPNRLLGSGLFHLPLGLVVSPVVDLHTGFRYSNVDVLNNYVGRPNSERLPTYFSLDFKAYKDFPLPALMGAHMKQFRFRIGIYTMNATNHNNPHDVYNNVTSPVFGHLVGYQHRVNGILIDLIR